ncbi:MAG TPA: BON domain-containing protein [Caulobacteraceae bacterium]
MAKEDDWREQRRWDFDREAQRRADYGQADPSPGYRRDPRHDDDGPRIGYRAAREDAWLDERRRAEQRSAPRLRDERAYSPFGATGPTAYYDSPYAWGPGVAPYGYGAPFAGMMGAYGGARSDYAPGRHDAAPPAARPGEQRSFIDKAADQLASWFGDSDADRRRHEDELQASHRGRGPKGYKRSDARIQEDINDRLTEDPYLDATDIEVSVADGEVTLAGMAPSREDKRRAERLAEQVSGVGDVQNNLRLRRSDEIDTGEKPSAGNF